MHNGGMNDWVIDAGDTEAMRPACELAHRAVIYGTIIGEMEQRLTGEAIIISTR